MKLSTIISCDGFSIPLSSLSCLSFCPFKETLLIAVIMNHENRGDHTDRSLGLYHGLNHSHDGPLTPRTRGRREYIKPAHLLFCTSNKLTLTLCMQALSLITELPCYTGCGIANHDTKAVSTVTWRDQAPAT